jgi:hypothetical protein
MTDHPEALAALRDLKPFFVWMGAIVLVALIGWWLSEPSPRDEEEPDYVPKVYPGPFSLAAPSGNARPVVRTAAMSVHTGDFPSFESPNDP